MHDYDQSDLLQESGVCVNPSASSLDYTYEQGFSAFTPDTASSVSNYEDPFQIAAAPQSLSQSRSPQFCCGIRDIDANALSQYQTTHGPLLTMCH